MNVFETRIETAKSLWLSQEKDITVKVQDLKKDILEDLEAGKTNVSDHIELKILTEKLSTIRSTLDTLEFIKG